ncbi:uncharacterized protein LOC121838462, partial [Ixodes scapularis]|uniref:uncharacterized protein LOC121838462 n=1 Tax=Ixodes scapularis TaxID=6945 RepID=UPI001C3871A5
MQDLPPAHRTYKSSADGWSRTTAQATEFLWNQVRLTLPPKKKSHPREGNVVVLGDIPVPEPHQNILKKGPKFCFEPTLKRVDKLVLPRFLSRNVPEEDKPRCITECVDVLLKSEGSPKRSRSLDPTINFLSSNNLNVMLSDKEGCFVVIPNGSFSEKAHLAIQKNFREVSERPAEIKRRTIKFLTQLNLEKVASAAKKGENLTLMVFFSAKTHKPGIPFRTIVSERNTWQHAISGYLQKQLNSLSIVDPLRIPNSKVVIDFLRDSNLEGCTAFSIDVEDL